MSYRALYLPLLLVCLCVSSCIRYVPARSEITKDKTPEELAQSGILGAEEFYKYERTLKEHVDSLVAARQSMAINHSIDSYRLGAGDVLEFDVFGLPNLHSEVQISPNGGASFPLLSGELQAGGKTLFELKNQLVGALAKYVKNPQVKLLVKDFQAHKVAVTGAVAKPGLYPLHRVGALVSDLIAEAGGRTEKAGNRVLLMPVSSMGAAAEPNAFGVEVDFEDLLGSAVTRPVMIPLVGGDTIIVPEAGTFEVEGEVKTPGSYKITNKKSVMGAIAAAGGFGYAAKVREVEVIRDIGSGKKAYVALNLEDIALKGQDDVRVRDGDLIRVPTESGRHVERQIVESINAIFRGVGVQGRVN